MFETKIEVFEGSTVSKVTREANEYRKNHNAEIISADLEYVPGGAVAPSIVFLTVVFREKR